MTETKRTKNIAFRLTDEEYEQIEKTAAAAGDDPNTWCRKLALSKSSEGHTFTENERMLYKEIALLRFLVGHGFKLMLSNEEATAATWKKLTAQADQKSDRIVEELLSRRQ
ncbi:MAG: plasmid mobilization protein [Pyrinomonadaceae bacterium]